MAIDLLSWRTWRGPRINCLTASVTAMTVDDEINDGVSTFLPALAMIAGRSIGAVVVQPTIRIRYAGADVLAAMALTMTTASLVQVVPLVLPTTVPLLNAANLTFEVTIGATAASYDVAPVLVGQVLNGAEV